MAGVVTPKNLDRLQILQTVFCSPGMGEKCKVVIGLSRQTILLLSRFLEKTLEQKDGAHADEILSILPDESADELQLLKEELLKKSGLHDLYERLKVL